MIFHRNTKILATLGPNSLEDNRLERLVDSGVNIFRYNFSHGDHDTLKNVCQAIRDVSKATDQHIGLLADLQGPKLRIGTFKDKSITLEIGQTLRLDMDGTPGDETRVCLPHPEVLGVLEVGHAVFLDDGKVRARVIEKGDDYVVTEIEAGAKLSNKKGLNVPGAVIPLAALTEKDKADLQAALDAQVDWIAQSFVQTAQDVQEARDLIGDKASLMVKIEKPSALDELEEIIALADGVMLARGDLGVEMPPETVPSIQKRVVKLVRQAGKPVVVATQMLESMIESPRPTRAEASDVATAVYDGTDAVMLSAETAVGAHPIKAVEIMDRICRHSEQDEAYLNTHYEAVDVLHESPSDAITAAAHMVADEVGASFIVTYTSSGSTALRMARQRSDIPILCLTPDKRVAQKLSVSYGVNAVFAPETIAEDFTGPARHAAKIAKDIGLGQAGDRFVMTAGVPFGTPGSTNLLRVAKIT